VHGAVAGKKLHEGLVLVTSSIASTMPGSFQAV
jgi:hypothetical protein